MIFYDAKTGEEVYRISPYSTLNELENRVFTIWLNFYEQKNEFKNEIEGLKNEIANLKSENEKLKNWLVNIYDD